MPNGLDLEMLANGTYLKSNGHFLRVEATGGYWVATGETTLEETQDGELVGVWTDAETGKTWIDKTQFVAGKMEALLTAKAYDQIAIWDNSNQTEIKTY